MEPLKRKDSDTTVAAGPPNAAASGFSNRNRIRRARINSALPRSQGWAIWSDPSGDASEEVFDNKLQIVAEVSSSAQFHEKWCRIKRESVPNPSFMVRIFRAGVLPFRSLSKNRNGGAFVCELHTGLSFAEAASSFGTIAALLIDGDLRWAEGVNGVCLNFSRNGHTIQLWSGSALDHSLAPIASVIEQLNNTRGVRENLKDPVTFKISKAADASPPPVPQSNDVASAEPEPVPEPSGQTPSPVPAEKIWDAKNGWFKAECSPPPSVPAEAPQQASAGEALNLGPAAAKTEAPPPGETPASDAEQKVVEERCEASPEPAQSSEPAPAKEGSAAQAPDAEASAAPKAKKATKAKRRKGNAQASSEVAAAPQELSPEEQEAEKKAKREKALARAERDFQKMEGGSNWSRERSIAWLWLLAFPLVYVVIGWLFCLIMNNTNPGAYPKWFSL